MPRMRSIFTFFRTQVKKVVSTINQTASLTEGPVRCVVYQMLPFDELPTNKYDCQILSATENGRMSILLVGSMDDGEKMADVEITVRGRMWRIEDSVTYPPNTVVFGSGSVVRNWT